MKDIKDMIPNKVLGVEKHKKPLLFWVVLSGLGSLAAYFLFGLGIFYLNG